MNKTFNLLLSQKAKVNSQGEVPIYMRITIDGKISELSTKRTVLSSKWNSQAQSVKGSFVNLLISILKHLNRKFMIPITN